jgi:uncharacterized protein with von Willebrand factor type A (vWA) domain
MPPLPGHLADNVVHFARVLRRAGLPIGTDRVLLALRALEVAGLDTRDDLYAVLAACLIDRREHLALFDQAFQIFWRDPDLLGSIMIPILTPEVGGATSPPANRRLVEALLAGGERDEPLESPQWEREAQLSWSAQERLGKADFDAMTTGEWEQARRLVGQLRPLFPRLATRRTAPSARGAAIDLRALLRAAARHGGDFVALPRRRRRRRGAPLVAIVDISGSMSRYSRMFLHFLHAISSADQRVTAFVFGTRLTPISRPLRAKDPDVAIAAVVRAVDDWSGGTRIGDTLHAFNRDWARRVLGAGATVLLVSDGLEQGSAEALGRETERLAKSCRRLIWLNPLLRYDGFEPKARGVRAILPFVDALVPMHNVDSLGGLARVLAGGAASRAPARASVQ